MTCIEINAAVYTALLQYTAKLTDACSLIPPPPPPPPPPESGDVAEYQASVVEWQKDHLLPALKGACSG